MDEQKQPAEATFGQSELTAGLGAKQKVPLTEELIVACLVSAGCLGTVRMTYESGPYGITRASCAAERLVRAIERQHGIGA